MTSKAIDLSDSPRLADGAWSSILRGLGLDLPCVETANLTHAHEVERLAQEYVAAGVHFLSTNTFSANRWALAKRGGGADVVAVNQVGAKIAARVAHPHGVQVAGVIGPSGKILAVREVSEEELTVAFGEQAEALAAGGADLMVLETFSELAEVRLALRVVKERTGLPVVACLSFDSGPQRTRTVMGTEAEECAAALASDGADMVGCNCGAGISLALPAVVALRAHSRLPLWVKPSAGIPDLEDGRTVYHVPPEEFAGQMPKLIEAGASVVGGCCGVGPEHIRRLSLLLEGRRRSSRSVGAKTG
jgi:methionine synthase I (cobalamin-dependent)